MWALDFMYETLYYGRPFRTLSVIDESSREILAIEVDISLPEARVVRTLEQTILNLAHMGVKFH